MMKSIRDITDEDLAEMCQCHSEEQNQYSNLESLYGAEVRELDDAILFFQNLYALGYDPLKLLK